VGIILNPWLLGKRKALNWLIYYFIPKVPLVIKGQLLENFIKTGLGNYFPFKEGFTIILPG